MDGTMSDAWESDDEWGHVGVRRLAEARQARPEKEREIIIKAESYWQTKATEQEQQKTANHAALMERLSMSLHPNDHFTDGSSEEIEYQFSDTDILNLHLETLSGALDEAGVRIRHLLLPTVNGRAIKRKSPSIQHLFTGLTSLSFDLHDPAEMLNDYDEQPPSFRTLIQCTRHTLEKLQFSSLFAFNMHRPRRGEHLLEKLWGYEPGSGTEAFVFPRLKQLELISLVLYTPSLIAFLKAQPALEKAVFKHIYLPTRGYGWPDVAAALPPSCHSLHLDHCGGQTTPRDGPDPPPDSNITHSDIERFRPYKHPFPEACGWRASKSYFEREAEKYAVQHHGPQGIRIAEQIAAAQSSLLHGESDSGPSLGELLKQSMDLDRRTTSKIQKFNETIKSLDYADYERL
ncbi:uncharacterized protein N0V89_003260 [Didymosphaeria variabile]|uniref:Uncharacterized protein n=1 Tax=Didymosphaeria variabile TaxID=1932322 RepID=A0A9W8XU29_9PLEO|nr:uncharacterized protein N0V89_003260 [Didymosphaeria variabile]KAJ4358676.1 hypothetical protein N0V89_003260 [Didymosphaeria variabile]